MPARKLMQKADVTIWEHFCLLNESFSDGQNRQKSQACWWDPDSTGKQWPETVKSTQHDKATNHAYTPVPATSVHIRLKGQLTIQSPEAQVRKGLIWQTCSSILPLREIPDAADSALSRQSQPGNTQGKNEMHKRQFDNLSR
jgi:hypothetical protein